jgi:hypothetical protein
MRRAILILGLVVGFTFVAAEGAMTLIATDVATYTLGLGSGPIVDVWDITVDAGEGSVVGSLIAYIGTDANMGYDDPFQAAWHTSGKTPQTWLTPTQEDANALLLPLDSTKCYECDTHFLPPGIGSSTEWPTYTLAPTETNDASIYGVYDDDYVAGVGPLSVSKAVPTALRTQVMDVAQVGVLRGTEVLVYVNGEWVILPEPATVLLLGPGAVMLLRRRRVRQRVASPM